MNETEKYFKNVADRLLNVVTSPSDLIRNLTEKNPYLLPMLLGLGGIVALKFIKK